MYKKKILLSICLGAVLVTGSVATIALAGNGNAEKETPITVNKDVMADSEVEDTKLPVYTIEEYEAEIANFENSMEIAIANGAITRTEAEETLKDMRKELQKLKSAGNSGEYAIYKPVNTKDIKIDAITNEYTEDTLVGDYSDINDGVVVTGSIGNHTFGDFDSEQLLIEAMDEYEGK
ncbi:hypothetical protein ADH76_01440 [Enterocloster clostridioformis]|nr:hypothetical protein A4V08_02975 [Lachnoclostridium sp. YL32]NDO27692.1 hypothetical protein [Enterocloster clostridioformis]OXE70154.1 hypothetical protein ADH76_01440 [Enterocloster clostridioformis]QQR00299.1 hypothetical protein I5Q83_31685 [Enterocloster clostridioformis]